jgi:hypothetical protein
LGFPQPASIMTVKPIATKDSSFVTSGSFVEDRELRIANFESEKSLMMQAI